MRLSALVTATVLLVGGIAFYIDARSRPVRLPQAPRPVAEPLPVYAAGSIEGATEPIALRPEVAGQVVAVHCAPGKRVHAGDLLVELDTTELQARLAEAKAAADAALARLAELVNGPRPEELEAARQRVLAARARAKLYEVRYQRLLSLWERNGARREEVDDEQQRYLAAAAEHAAAVAEYELLQAGSRLEQRQAAEAEVAAAQARVRQLETLLAKSNVRAPVSGIVADVNCRVGEIIGPATANPPILLIDDSRSRVRAFVEEYDVPRVQPGARARIAVDGMPDQTFTGTVSEIEGVVKPKTFVTFEPGERYDTRVLEVWIDLDEPVRLPVGLRVDVTIEPATREVAEGNTRPYVPTAPVANAARAPRRAN